MRECSIRQFSPQRTKKYLAFALAVNLIATVPISVFAQVLKTSMMKTNVSIESVPCGLEEQSEYTLFYNDNQVKLNKKVPISVSGAPIETVPNEIFKNPGYTYKIADNRIAVSIVTVAAKDVQTVQQQKQRKTIGVVRDAMGETIIGASVVEKGTTSNGTTINIEGEFILNTAGKELRITYTGYIPQTIILKSGVNNYNVIMKEDTKTLDGVVVVSYGTQKKVNLTGAVSSVGTGELESRVNTDVLTSVQEQVPGATIITHPGGSTSINFRGHGNLGTSLPLYAIDGVIAGANFFSSLDPNSIGSTSLLEDTVSSAIYGSCAAYGVILVKIKGGEEGDLKMAYDGYVGFKSALYTPNILSSEWYARLSNEAVLNDNPSTKLLYTDEEIAKFRDGIDPDLYPNTNWYDLVLKDNATITKYIVSISEGNKVKYYTSLGYLYNDKLTPGATTDRYNITTNISANVREWLAFYADINYNQTYNDNSKGGVSHIEMLTTPSTYVARQSNGEYGSHEAGRSASQVSMNRNPLRCIEPGDWSNSRT